MRFGKHGSEGDDERFGIEGLKPLDTPGTQPDVPAIPYAAGTDGTADAAAGIGAGEPAGTNANNPAGAANAGGTEPAAFANAAQPKSFMAPTPGVANPYTPGAQPTGFVGSTDPESGMDEAECEAYAKLKAMRAERRRKKLIRRGVAAGVAVALVAGVFIFNLVKSNTATDEVQVVTQPAYTGTLTTEVTGSGSIEPASSNIVQPQIDGTIETVDVVAGQQVKAGDTLFTIKNDDLDRAVNEAARTVRSAKQKVNEAQKALDAAKSQASYTGTNDATATGRTSGATISQAGLARSATFSQVDGQEGDEADGTAASSGTTSSDEGIASAQNELESAQIELEAANDAYNKAKDQADQRIVKSPIDGSVIELNAQVGASVGQGATNASGTTSSTLCQVADLSQMMVTVQVSEVDINKIALDQNATATFSALPNVSLSAQVRSIASTSSSDGYGSGGVTYAVQLVIPEPDESLKPGMTANVSITTSQVDNALIVPSTAVTAYGDGTGCVYVEIDPTTHETTPVTVEILGDNGSEAAVRATDGSLADGDPVVVSGAFSDDAGGYDSGTYDESDDSGQAMLG